MRLIARGGEMESKSGGKFLFLRRRQKKLPVNAFAFTEQIV